MLKCTTCSEVKPTSEFVKDSQRKRGYTYDCKVCRNKKKSNWREKNRDKIRASDKIRYYNRTEEQKQKDLAYHRKRRPRYQPKITAREAKRRSLKYLATPKWLSESQLKEIEEIYWLADDIRKTSGEKYHVDHIIPLVNEVVCGLHVPWNLQILPADINHRKSNKMYGEIK